MEEMKMSVQEYIETIRQRIIERGVKVGKPDILAKHPEGKHFSSLELVILADELETSFHYLVTGEPDPYEVRIISCSKEDMENWG